VDASWEFVDTSLVAMRRAPMKCIRWLFRMPPSPLLPPSSPPSSSIVAIVITLLTALLTVALAWKCAASQRRHQRHQRMRTLTSSGSVSTSSIGGEKSSLPPTRRPPTPERRSATAKSHRGAARLDVDELPANWLDEDFEISLITLIGRRFRRLQYTRFDLLLGSIVSQFGHSADLAISSGLALVAVTAQYILRRMRQLDGSGPEWIHRRISRLKARMERLLGRLRVEALAAWLYPKVDMDGDGSVDRVELHCMCLQLYSKVTQFMPQVLTPPSKAHTDRLFAAFDIDDSGRIERAEWELLASVLALTVTLTLTLTSTPTPTLTLALTALALAPSSRCSSSPSRCASPRSRQSRSCSRHSPPPSPSRTRASCSSE